MFIHTIRCKTVCLATDGIKPLHPKFKDRKLQHRALKIINGRHGRNTFPAIKAINDKRCAIEVFKFINGLASNLLENYICKQNHTEGSRGNIANLVLSPFRTEAARKTFNCQGTQIYNKIPTALTAETSFLRFKTSYKAFFFIFLFLSSRSLIYSS